MKPASILAAAVALAPSGAAVGQTGAPFHFPVVVEPAQVRIGPAAGGPILEQSVRSERGARLTAPLTVPFEAPRRRGAGRTGVLPSGTLLVLARAGARDIYCAVANDGTPGPAPFGAAVCLADTDGDRVFDRQFVTPDRGLIRTPYAISSVGPDAAWSAIQAPYTPAPRAEIDPVRLTLRYGSSGGRGPLSSRKWLLGAQICFPESLVVPYGRDLSRVVCGVPPGADKGTAFTSLRERPGMAETVAYGPLSATVTLSGDTRVVNAASGLPAGPARLWLSGRWVAMAATVPEISIAPGS